MVVNAVYTKVDNVNIAQAKTAYRTIEIQTNDYIMGSVPLGNYPESEDVHVYADSAGWVVAYYLKAEPASKIVDWKAYQTAGRITGSKIETALSAVANAMASFVSQVSYYDFRFSSATQMMIIVDDTLSRDSDEEETFRLMVPSSNIVFSATWSHAGIDGNGSHISSLRINNVELNSVYCDEIEEGNILGGQMPPDTHHTISVTYDGYCEYVGAAILLIYR